MRKNIRSKATSSNSHAAPTRALNYRLWLARKRRGLGQKQVASLLGHKTVNQVYQYERDLRKPPLRTALKLELIYGRPIKWLFADIATHASRQLREQIQSCRSMHKRQAELLNDLEHPGDFCSYSERLDRREPTDLEREKIRRHVTILAKKLAGL